MAKTKPVARVTLPTSQKSAPKNAKLAAAKLSPAERVEITIRVRRKPGAGTPTIGATPLTREQYREAYGADPADIEKIEDFANAHGLDIVQSSVSQRAVRLSGTVAAMQGAFGVHLKSYQVSNSKQRFRGRTGTISVPKAINPGGKKGRGVPDICGNADGDTGYLIRVDGQTVPIGGTSTVSPLWAGLIALINQGRPHPVGFITPQLYALKPARKALHDITVGDNGVNKVKGYAGKVGWDPCTGLGSPHGENLLAVL